MSGLDRALEEAGAAGLGRAGLFALAATRELFVLGPLPRLLEPIGLAFDREDLGLVSESVDEGDHRGGAGEDFVPVTECLVGGDDGRDTLITTIDDLEKQVSGASVVGEITDLVDAQQLGACVMTEPLL